MNFIYYKSKLKCFIYIKYFMASKIDLIPFSPILLILSFYILISITLNSILKYLYILRFKVSAYFWEFVKIYKRFLIYFIISYFNKDIITKGLLLSSLLIIYLILLNVFKPF